ncbi:MAG: Smr/MutS family protein [Gammaproteobacteria bacterium]|nr:Smr/MutS family protein [Gammaproteobacteria bacterium]
MTNKKDPPSDDHTLFRQQMGDTTPIKQRTRHQHRSPPKPIAVMRRRDERAALEESWNDIPPDDIADELSETMVYQAPQLNKKAFRELRRGKLAIQDYIDLHGMTVTEAMNELRDFIRHASNNRLRCVRIVTGKGLRSKQGPKIRPKVMKWLQHCDVVLGYAPAPQHDGGSGALYVLLG